MFKAGYNTVGEKILDIDPDNIRTLERILCPFDGNDVAVCETTDGKLHLVIVHENDVIDEILEGSRDQIEKHVENEQYRAHNDFNNSLGGHDLLTAYCMIHDQLDRFPDQRYLMRYASSVDQFVKTYSIYQSLYKAYLDCTDATNLFKAEIFVESLSVAERNLLAFESFCQTGDFTISDGHKKRFIEVLPDLPAGALLDLGISDDLADSIFSERKMHIYYFMDRIAGGKQPSIFGYSQRDGVFSYLRSEDELWMWQMKEYRDYVALNFDDVRGSVIERD